MAILKDLTGRRFGRWIVLSFHGVKNGGYFWLCKCDCGKTKVVPSVCLSDGRSKSCGCLRNEELSKRQKTHGKSYTVEYYVWRGMKERCLLKSQISYKIYGGRGISVSPDWLGDGGFEHFLRDMGKRPEGKYTIERKDNNGNYCKENCYWMLRDLQFKNMRSNQWIEFDGRKMIVADWARELQMDYMSLYSRIKRGWTIEEALFTPLRTRKKKAA